MNDKFNEQKDTLISINKEINLLHQQVDFLLRNEKPLGLLDLDVMMNRTHNLYDQMCSINLGDYTAEVDEDSIDEDSIDETSILDALLPDPVSRPRDVRPEVSLDCHVASASSNPEGLTDQTGGNDEEEPVVDENDQPIVDEEETVVEENEDENDADDLGFILNFEPAEHKEEPETLADKLQQEEDHSLASKLQHSAVNDLRSVIGINDKFLLVNELFGGSMEKYNKSIDNLNDLKTLNGALVYMNELRVELQWNSSNEAYKKLLELVHRKFD